MQGMTQLNGAKTNIDQLLPSDLLITQMEVTTGSLGSGTRSLFWVVSQVQPSQRLKCQVTLGGPILKHNEFLKTLPVHEKKKQLMSPLIRKKPLFKRQTILEVLIFVGGPGAFLVLGEECHAFPLQ